MIPLESIILSKLTPLKITEYAYEKAVTYAKKTYKIYGSEYYGLLLKPRGAKNFIIRDVLYSPKQRANYTNTFVSPEGVSLARKEAFENGYEILGWCHSHSDFEPFQSPTDTKNTTNILNILALTNYIDVIKSNELLNGYLETTTEEERIIVKDKISGRVILIEINGNFLLDKGSLIEKIKLLIPRRVGFCYSLTVNANGDKPSTQLGLQYEIDKENIETKLIDCGIEIMDSSDMLEKEIKRKMENGRR